MFNGFESRQRVPQGKQVEEIEDLEIRITESPRERNREFKALDLNGVTISFDADEVHVVYGGNGLIYVSVIGNLIVLYDRKEDLDGFWFAAESIQKIKIDEYSKPENSKSYWLDNIIE